MKIRRPIFSSAWLVMAVLLLPFHGIFAGSSPFLQNQAAIPASISFVPNIETIGVAVSGTSLPSTAELAYRKSGETVWQAAHSLVRIDDGRLIGSLFNLLPSTSYEIKVFSGASEVSGTASTQPEQLSFTPSATLYVDDNASPGGNGSAALPYKTIQEAVNHAVPGTQVLVADGLYREAITFPASGTPGNWIQVKASGTAAILDSSDYYSGKLWTSYASHVWFMKVSGPVAYVARDGKRFYQYDDKNGLLQGTGHENVSINEGWFYEPGTTRLYVRSLDDPSSHNWRIPRLNHAFEAGARDWIWIEGFEIRFYGTTTNGCGVCSVNASHLVIRKNRIHNMQLGIFIYWTGGADRGNDTRIVQNDISDPGLYGLPWDSLKGSLMEGTAVILRGHIGAIVRDNHISGYFNGIYTGSSGALENAELAFDADVYRNHMVNISDDGLEPEGACVNHRFRENTVDRSFIGLSVAPVTQGPTWVLRSTFSNFTGRGIKFADDSDGIVFLYHNTAWTNVSNINGADLITPIHNVVMRNNIFQSTGYSIYEVPTGSTGNDWDHDNWYTTRGAAGPHFKWENVNYNTIAALCSARGLECSGYENIPGFTNPAGGDFTLMPSSVNIDRGVLIPGINDHFLGNAPDAGAYEFPSASYPVVASIVRTDANPPQVTTVGFTVTFSKPVTGVDLSDFKLTTAGVTAASITNLSGSGAAYNVMVSTGSGNGAIRLDVVDNDSIKDVDLNPLGGPGAGNGSYTSGERYNLVAGADTVGVFRPSNGVIFLKNSNTSGFADIALNYGLGGDYPVVGDWDGNGTDTIGVYRGNTFLLRNSNTVGNADLSFVFGQAGDQPIAGDWDGDGVDTVGLYRPSTGQFLLRNSNSAGAPDAGFYLGNVGDIGIAGDWDGDGIDTTGVFRPSSGVIYLKNKNETGFADVALNYGLAGDKPVVGDWDNNGTTTIGIYRSARFYLRNSNTNGFADITLDLGIPGDMPIAGNWDGLP